MVRLLAAQIAVTVLLITSCGPAGGPSATAAPAATAAAFSRPCATGGLAQSSVQAPPPATATVAPPPTAPAASPAAPATATPTLRPAPTTDRVGFPEDYQTKFKFAYVYDRQEGTAVPVWQRAGVRVLASARGRAGQPDQGPERPHDPHDAERDLRRTEGAGLRRGVQGEPQRRVGVGRLPS